MQTSRQIEQTEPVIGDERLNFVIVPGDVRTTVAVARIWTCAPRRRSARRGGTQQALPARCVFSTPEVPTASACGSSRPASRFSRSSPTNSSPDPASRKPMSVRSGRLVVGAGATSPAPAVRATCSGVQVLML